MTSPAILVRVDRRLVERVLPGAVAEAQALAEGFDDPVERESWIAGRLGMQLEGALVGEAASRSPGLVDVAELARILGVSRGTVYEHADELGAVRIGSGAKPRLRFDAHAALEAWGQPATFCSKRTRSMAPDCNEGAGATPATATGDSAVLPLAAHSRLPAGPAPRGRNRVSGSL